MRAVSIARYVGGVHAEGLVTHGLGLTALPKRTVGLHEHLIPQCPQVEGILLRRLGVQRLQRLLEAEALLLLGSRVTHTGLPLTALLDEPTDELNQVAGEFPIPIAHLLLLEEELSLPDQLLGVPEVNLPVGLPQEVFAQQLGADVVESEGVLDEAGKAL